MDTAKFNSRNFFIIIILSLHGNRKENYASKYSTVVSELLSLLIINEHSVSFCSTGFLQKNIMIKDRVDK